MNSYGRNAFLPALAGAVLLLGSMVANAATVDFTYASSTVLTNPTVNGITILAGPGSDVSQDNAFNPGTDVRAGFFSITSAPVSTATYSSPFVTSFTVTDSASSTPGTFTVNGNLSVDANSTQSNNTLVTTSDLPQTLNIGGINYTLSFSGFDHIGAIGAQPASFSFHVTAPPGVTTTVPEPGSLAMFGAFGLSGLGMFIRRRKA